MMLPENQIVLWIYSFIIWSAMYICIAFFIKIYTKSCTYLSDADKAHMAEGCISSVQGFVCGGAGIAAVIAARHDVMNAKHWFVLPYSTIGSAYFIYDLAAMYYSHCLQKDSKGLPWVKHTKLYFQRSLLMIMHHIILIFLLFPALVYYSNMGDFFTGCFYLTELSTPFVNMRVVLSKFGMKSSKMYIINGVLMTVMFALCRVIMFPFMYLTYLSQYSKGISYLQALSRVPWHCHIGSSLVLAPQIYWLFLMLRGVFAVFFLQPKYVAKYD
uniref:Protein FAM57A-like n=1 Tax=Hirondellea gigas TaxID=1518452 RepID=A0A2P2I5F9_9CRUS